MLCKQRGSQFPHPQVPQFGNKIQGTSKSNNNNNKTLWQFCILCSGDFNFHIRRFPISGIRYSGHRKATTTKLFDSSQCVLSTGDLSFRIRRFPNSGIRYSGHRKATTTTNSLTVLHSQQRGSQFPHPQVSQFGNKIQRTSKSNNNKTLWQFSVRSQHRRPQFPHPQVPQFRNKIQWTSKSNNNNKTLWQFCILSSGDLNFHIRRFPSLGIRYSRRPGDRSPSPIMSSTFTITPQVSQRLIAISLEFIWNISSPSFTLHPKTPQGPKLLSTARTVGRPALNLMWECSSALPWTKTSTRWFIYTPAACLNFATGIDSYLYDVSPL